MGEGECLLWRAVDVVNGEFLVPIPNSCSKDVVRAVGQEWCDIALYVVPHVGYDSSAGSTLTRMWCISCNMEVDIGVEGFL